MTQKDVAAKMGITQAAYCQLEKSQDRLRPATLKKIARALGVTENQLCCKRRAASWRDELRAKYK